MFGVCILSVGFSIPSPVTTGEYPLPAATNTVNKQCWLGNPTSRPVNYSVNKSNMFLCFSQVCGRLQQRERILRRAKRVQVSQSSLNICGTTCCNLGRVSGGRYGAGPVILAIVVVSDGLPAPRPWLPSGRSSPDNLTRWSVYSVMSRLPYDPNIDTLSLGRSEDCYIA